MNSRRADAVFVVSALRIVFASHIAEIFPVRWTVVDEFEFRSCASNADRTPEDTTLDVRPCE
jgi:hypothetical protein